MINSLIFCIYMEKNGPNDFGAWDGGVDLAGSGGLDVIWDVL